jgi:hypothetical protein
MPGGSAPTTSTSGDPVRIIIRTGDGGSAFRDDRLALASHRIVAGSQLFLPT